MKNFAIAAVAVVAAVAGSASASAATTVYNANIAAPGVYFGSGNTNGRFAVATELGVELGLRGHIYQQSNPTPVGNVYSFSLGQSISFDYSFNPGADGSRLSPLTGVTNLITVTKLGTAIASTFDPSSWWLFNSTNSGAPGGYQNSERLQFGWLGLDYDANEDATYEVSWNYTSNQTGTISNKIVLVQGAGSGVAAVPEPASWAMMIGGLAIVGGTMRRRATKVSFA